LQPSISAKLTPAAVRAVSITSVVAAFVGLVSSEKLEEIRAVVVGDLSKLGRYVREIERGKELGDCSMDLRGKSQGCGALGLAVRGR